MTSSHSPLGSSIVAAADTTCAATSRAPRCELPRQPNTAFLICALPAASKASHCAARASCFASSCQGRARGSGSGSIAHCAGLALPSSLARTHARSLARTLARTHAHAATRARPLRASTPPTAHLGAQAVLEHEASTLSHTHILRLVGKLGGHDRHQHRLRAGGPAGGGVSSRGARRGAGGRGRTRLLTLACSICCSAAARVFWSADMQFISSGVTSMAPASRGLTNTRESCQGEHRVGKRSAARSGGCVVRSALLHAGGPAHRHHAGRPAVHPNDPVTGTRTAFGGIGANQADVSFGARDVISADKVCAAKRK